VIDLGQSQSENQSKNNDNLANRFFASNDQPIERYIKERWLVERTSFHPSTEVFGVYSKFLHHTI
jgi:hypothetical protein